MKAGSITVLCVDDNSASRDLTKLYLERSEPQLSIVSEPSVKAGLEQLRERDVDCVVSDYEMPRQNGLEFLEAVRREHPSLPFVLYTRREPEQMATKALEAGVDAYYQKQIGSGQYPLLANEIVTLVEKHRVDQRLLSLEREKHVADGGVTPEEHAHLRDEAETMSLAVIGAVAEREGVDVLELPPLHEAIDPEALDALFPPNSADAERSAEELTFSYQGYSITISADGEITLDGRGT